MIESWVEIDWIRDWDWQDPGLRFTGFGVELTGSGIGRIWVVIDRIWVDIDRIWG